MPGDEVEKADAFEILQALIAYTVCIKTVLVESVPRMVVTGVVESVITGSEMVSGMYEYSSVASLTLFKVCHLPQPAMHENRLQTFVEHCFVWFTLSIQSC